MRAKFIHELTEKVVAIEKKLNKELEITLLKGREHQEQKDQLSKQLSAFGRQNMDADKAMALLSQSLEITKAKLRSAQDKIMLLTDENRFILQEKAVIQGQFKQLQASLCL